MARLRPVDFEDRLTLVEHLDELRTRIVISVLAFAAAFAVCFWQNDRLLDIANAPLPGDRVPITFGVAEPFTTTVTISAYAALVIALPVLLYQAYAFVLPALTTREKRVVVPFLIGVPILFVAGVVFGYFVVLPAATKFLLNFNDNQFNIQVRARDYYSCRSGSSPSPGSASSPRSSCRRTAATRTSSCSSSPCSCPAPIR
jgi:sec-independent protein translocase protein TatC